MKNILIILSCLFTSHMTVISHNNSDMYKNLQPYMLGKKKKKLEHKKKKNIKKENSTFIPENKDNPPNPHVSFSSCIEAYIFFCAIQQRPCVLF